MFWERIPRSVIEVHVLEGDLKHIAVIVTQKQG